MSLTLHVLLDTDAGNIAAASDAWNAMAGALDDACEDLIRSSRDIEYAWPEGPAAQAAHTAPEKSATKLATPCNRAAPSPGLCGNTPTPS